MVNKLIMLSLVALNMPLALHARIVSSWTDRQIFEKADFVVIARPTSSRNTSEHTRLNNIEPPVDVIGVDTDFETCLILKGEKDITKFRLHHYTTNEQFTNGPSLIKVVLEKRPAYLMFLIREKDGRYVPATDQTDPAEWSVLRLRGATGSRMEQPDLVISCHNGHRKGDSRDKKMPTPYSDMFLEADLVVIANWIATRDTEERATLSIAGRPEKVLGLTTEFECRLVLKGPNDVKSIDVHYYKLQSGDDASPSNAQLVRILPPSHRDGMYYPGGGRFLLFLRKELDGRYAPAGGQIDPGVTSILMLTSGDH